MRQLFGTDGIRGVAGEYPLDRATAFAVGVALVSGVWNDFVSWLRDALVSDVRLPI